jgi:hypothetical protein
MALLYDVIESPLHPDLGGVAATLGLERLVFTAQRKAIAQLRRRPPAIIAADFFFGYGNNYAGANVSNLDVLLRSVQRFAPDARVIVFADRRELPHTDKLVALFDIHAIVPLPTDRDSLLEHFPAG